MVKNETISVICIVAIVVILVGILPIILIGTYLSKRKKRYRQHRCAYVTPVQHIPPVQMPYYYSIDPTMTCPEVQPQGVYQCYVPPQASYSYTHC